MLGWNCVLLSMFFQSCAYERCFDRWLHSCLSPVRAALWGNHSHGAFLLQWPADASWELIKWIFVFVCTVFFMFLLYYINLCWWWNHLHPSVTFIVSVRTNFQFLQYFPSYAVVPLSLLRRVSSANCRVAHTEFVAKSPITETEWLV